MSSVGIRELQRDASGVVGRVVRTGRPTVVTNRGAVVAAVVPVDPDALEDYVLATAPAFVRAMRAADRELVEGRTSASADVFAALETSPTRPSKHRPEPVSPRLTDRERAVLKLVAEGRTNRQIADELGIKPPTVKQHIVRILAKLELKARTETGGN